MPDRHQAGDNAANQHDPEGDRSFLRQEGDVYHDVMRRTGDIAGAWQLTELSPLRRAWLHALPRGLRLRAALGLARRLANGTWEQTRSSRRWRAS